MDERSLNGYTGAGGASPASIDIREDGTIKIHMTSGPPIGDSQIQLAVFANPSGLTAIGNNLYMETTASGAPEVGDPQDGSFGAIKHKMLEGSNVAMVTEMVNIITTQR